MWLRRALCFLALAGMAGTAGCVVEIVFDPVGTDASVQGSWLVNGATPTTESCDALGVTNVRVRFYDGSRTVDHPGLVFACADGGFDTRPNAVLADGAWRMQLLAINATGDVIAEGPIRSYDTVVAAGHIVMDQVDFVAGSITAITGSWTIDGATPNATNCADLGIAQVGLEFLDGTGTPIPDTTVVIGCEAGSVTTQVAPGDYSVRVLALDDSSPAVVLEMGVSEMFTLAEGATHALNGGAPIDFVSAGFDPRGTDSALTALWDIGGVAGDTKSCEAVAATTVDLIFAAEDDTDFENEFVVQMGAPCDVGGFDSGTAVLAAGNYLLAAELKDSLGGVISRVEAGSAITVVAGTPVDVDVDFRLDSSTIHIFLEWEETMGGGTFADCTTAGVDSIEWFLYPPGGSTTPVAEGTGACAEFINVMSGVGGAALASGTYELDISGRLPASSAKTWSREGGLACEATIDAEGGLGTTTCSVARAL